MALQGVLNPVQRLVAVSSPSSAGAMTTASGAESSATGNGADRDDSPQVIVAPGTVAVSSTCAKWCFLTSAFFCVLVANIIFVRKDSRWRSL